MSFMGIAVIIAVCYIIGEIIKFIFKGRQDIYSFIPIILAIFGGILGVIIYLSNNFILNTNNIWNALLIGIISGESAAGTNQIFKQINKYKGGK